MVRDGVRGEQHATAAGQGDDRVQKASAHFAPWGRGNGNKDPDVSSTTLAQEALKLKGKKIDSEDSIEYILEEKYVSTDPKITKLNEEIVKKLNLMASSVALWNEASAEGGRELDIDISLRNVSNLTKQVMRLQKDIEEAGGVFVPIPEELQDIPDP